MENNRQLVIKSNNLIEACYKLTLQESRIILFLASQISQSDQELKYHIIPIKDLCKIAQIDTSSMYNTSIAIAENLMKKIIKIKTDNDVEQFAWLSYAKHNKRSGTVKLRFDEALKPYLLNLNRCFTSYRLSIVLKFKNIFSFRIYEILKQYENIGVRTISIQDLRWMLDLEKDKYPMYGNFKQKVIQVTKKELKDKSDIYFDFEEIKTGRTVVKLKFIIHKQKLPTPSVDKKNQINEDEVDVFINELVELLPEKYQKLASYRKLIIKYFEQNGKNYVIRNILYANDKSNDTNYRAYLSKSLEFDYGLAYQEDQEVKKEEAERQHLAKVKEAKEKADEKKRVDEERDMHKKAREMLKTLPESELKSIEKEVSQKLINKNILPTSATWPFAFRLNLESLFIERHPEEFK